MKSDLIERRRATDVLAIALAIAIDLVVWNGSRQLVDGRLLPLWIVPTATVVLYSSLWWRWQRPISLFALMWTWSLTSLVVVDYEPFTGLLLSLHAVASTQGRRQSALALGLCAVPFGIDSFNAAPQSTQTTFAGKISVFAVFWLALSTAAWGLGRRTFVMQQNAIAENVRNLRNQRFQLARDLHDSVASDISAIILTAGSYLQTCAERSDPETVAAFTTIAAIGSRATDELHHLLGLLRDIAPGVRSAPGHWREQSLEVLDALIADIGSTSGLQIDVRVQGEPRSIDRAVDQVAYRLVRESLNNAAKYANRGSAVEIALEWDVDALTLSVVTFSGDDARASSLAVAPPPSGLGLLGLRERIEMIGGRLTTTRHGHKFTVLAALPLMTTTKRHNEATGNSR